MEILLIEDFSTSEQQLANNGNLLQVLRARAAYFAKVPTDLFAGTLDPMLKQHMKAIDVKKFGTQEDGLFTESEVPIIRDIAHIRAQLNANELTAAKLLKETVYYSQLGRDIANIAPVQNRADARARDKAKKDEAKKVKKLKAARANRPTN